MPLNDILVDIEARQAVDDILAAGPFGRNVLRPMVFMPKEERALAYEEYDKEKLKDAFNTLLEGIKEITDVDAVISGGAVLAYFQGVMPKDIDVWLPMSRVEFDKVKDELPWALANVGLNDYGAAKGVHVHTRYSGAYKHHKLDVLLVDEPLTLATVSKTWPLNIQQGVYSLAEGLQTSDAFNAGCFFKSIKLMNGELTPQIGEKIKNLIKAKTFAGWKFTEGAPWWVNQNKAPASVKKGK